MGSGLLTGCLRWGGVVGVGWGGKGRCGVAAVWGGTVRQRAGAVNA